LSKFKEDQAMDRVTLKGHIIVPDDKLSTVQVALKRHIALTREERGCIVFEVTQDSEDKNKFHVYEEFVDRESFAAHQERVSNSSWGEKSKGLVRSYEIVGMQE